MAAVWRREDTPILPPGPQTLTLGLHFVMETEKLMNKHLIGANCDVTGSGQDVCQRV